MAVATRTTNPLPFQDLEPRRFEDLVRQLIYDFKVWRRLEATGRAGSDGSFDARGFEIVDPARDEETESADDEGASAAAPDDRLWLVQCKRERTMPPKRLQQYLDAIPAETTVALHGIIIAAACDFSKASRDVLAAWARRHGVAEFHMWGKGELEDQLYQPRNDNLLFAYFGISLQIRQRSIRTALRARLATKRRCEVILGKGESGSTPILLRDPNDDRYPFTDDEKTHRRGHWRLVTFSGHDVDGIKYVRRRHFAYLADDGKHWDMIDALDTERPFVNVNPWLPDDSEKQALHSRAWHYWYHHVPEPNRMTFIEEGIIPYDRILAIDPTGDRFATVPHVFLELAKKIPINIQVKLEPTNQFYRGLWWPADADRIKFFPDPLPEASLPPPAATDG